MLRVIFIALTILTPSLALAFDGVFTMRGVTQTKYYLPNPESLGKQKYQVYYTLRARERINHKNSDVIKNSYRKKTASKVLLYNDGSIEFQSFLIRFKRAYFFRGELYMENTHGVLDGNSISSREMVFNEVKGLLKADHIAINHGGTVSIKKRFRLFIPKK